MLVPRGLHVTFEVQTIQSPLLVNVLGNDLAGGRRGFQQLKVVRIQFAFHQSGSSVSAAQFFSA